MDKTPQHTPDGPLQIDLQAVLRAKLGSRRMRYVPAFAVRGVENMICAHRMNRLLRQAYPRRGGDFARFILEQLDITANFTGVENLPEKGDGRVLFVSNHPFGGVEGLAMIDFFTRRYGRFHVMVNDLLMAIDPLREVFLPVNKHGRQNEDSVRRVAKAFASDAPVLIFPAGLVSRIDGRGRLHDLTWRKTFVSLAIASHRDIVPMYVDGRNTAFFYRFARLRERLGIKLNIEMLRLPKEVFRMCGKSFGINIGKRIPCTELQGGPRAAETAAAICRTVYALAPGAPAADNLNN